MADTSPMHPVKRELLRLLGGVALVANPDLLAGLARARAERRSARPLLVGFAAEVENDPGALAARARRKLAEKGCDVVVANDIGTPGFGAGSDDNAVTVVFSDGKTAALGPMSKAALAETLWDRLIPRLPALASPAESAAAGGEVAGKDRGQPAGGGPRRRSRARPAVSRRSGAGGGGIGIKRRRG
jgi:hypothetical protein